MPVIKLEEDPAIRSQQYVCVSFVNPITYFQKQLEKSVNDFVTHDLNASEPLDLTTNFRDYLDEHLEKLEEKVDSRAGIKIRGAYSTREEAETRVQYLSKYFAETEPVPIYVAEVGKWVPLNPSDVTSDQLNFTLYEYTRVLADSKHEFEKRMYSVRKESQENAPVKTPVTDNADEPEPELTEPVKTDFADYDPSKDYVDEDVPIPSQKFVCVSLNSQTEQEHKLLEQAVRSFVFSYIREQNGDSEVRNIGDVYEAYRAFVREHPLQIPVETQIPAFKVRGVYMTEEEATKRSESLQNTDGTTDTLVALVGFWLPFAPAKGVDTKYHEPHLNAISDKFKMAGEYVEDAKQKMKALDFDPEDFTKTVDLRKPTTKTALEPVAEDVNDADSDTISSDGSIIEL
jgi:hypothetical protein